jgi:hypothetical protein
VPMSTDESAIQFSRARVALQGVLRRLRASAPESARETLVVALCDGLRSIPVPLVAPLAVIRLQVTLDSGTTSFPLFALNNEGPHQFAQEPGAERLD